MFFIILPLICFFVCLLRRSAGFTVKRLSRHILTGILPVPVFHVPLDSSPSWPFIGFADGTRGFAPVRRPPSVRQEPRHWIAVAGSLLYASGGRYARGDLWNKELSFLDEFARGYNP